MLRTLILDNSVTPFFLREGPLTRRMCPEPVRLIDGRRAPLPPPASFDRLILSGSEASAMSGTDWVVRQTDWLGEVIAAGKAVLGICFGHQLLARTLWGDGAVHRAARPELGWRTVTMETGETLFAHLPERVLWFCSHDDEVTPPANADPAVRIIARSSDCPVHAFRVCGKPVWGIQFHPEFMGTQARLITLVFRALGRRPANDGTPAGRRIQRRRAETLMRNFWEAAA